MEDKGKTDGWDWVEDWDKWRARNEADVNPGIKLDLNEEVKSE